MKWNFFVSCNGLGAVLACTLLFSGSAFAEKSLWQKFKDFFSPGETIECDVGPQCDEYNKLESRINVVEGKYSRERRPVNKDRYKKELDSLCVVRDSLVAIIKASQVSSSSAVAPGLSSEVQPVSSAALSASSSSIGVSSSSEALPVVSCKPDTVYVRDTVVVHDTLFVVVTNKPAEAPAESSSSQNETH